MRLWSREGKNSASSCLHYCHTFGQWFWESRAIWFSWGFYPVEFKLKYKTKRPLCIELRLSALINPAFLAPVRWSFEKSEERRVGQHHNWVSWGSSLGGPCRF